MVYGLILFAALWLFAIVRGARVIRAQRTAFEARLVPVDAEALRVDERARGALEEAAALGLAPEGTWEYVRERAGDGQRRKHTYVAAFLSKDGRAELLVSVVRSLVERGETRSATSSVLWAFHSHHSGARCTTFRSGDRSLVHAVVSQRDPKNPARPVATESVRELVDAHERHLSDVGWKAAKLEAAGAPARILDQNQAVIDRLLAGGLYERDGDSVRPTWKMALSGTLAAGGIPVGMEPRPARAAIVLAVIAFAGAVASNDAAPRLGALDAKQAELALAALFGVIGATTSALLPRSPLAWGFACLPAAIVLRTDRCPLAWIAAFLAAAVVLRATRARRFRNELARFESERAAAGDPRQR